MGFEENLLQIGLELLLCQSDLATCRFIGPYFLTILQITLFVNFHELSERKIIHFIYNF